jgi:hypothetical protein
MPFGQETTEQSHDEGIHEIQKFGLFGALMLFYLFLNDIFCLILLRELLCLVDGIQIVERHYIFATKLNR